MYTYVQAPKHLNVLAVGPGNTLVYYGGRGKDFPLSYTTGVADGGALGYNYYFSSFYIG